MNKKLKESFSSDLKTKMNQEMGRQNVYSSSEGAITANEFITNLPESEKKEQIIRKPKKIGNSDKLVSKTKMNLPIGKLYSIGKTESKEATGSGAAGGFSQPLFSSEMKEKWSEKYKRSIDCNNPKGFSQKAHCQGKKT